MTQPRIELVEDPEQALLAALRGLQASLWTALPAFVTKVDLAKMTVEVQPTIQARIRQPDQNFKWVTMPLCVDCPIIFPSTPWKVRHGTKTRKMTIWP